MSHDDLKEIEMPRHLPTIEPVKGATVDTAGAVHAAIMPDQDLEGPHDGDRASESGSIPLLEDRTGTTDGGAGTTADQTTTEDEFKSPSADLLQQQGGKESIDVDKADAARDAESSSRKDEQDSGGGAAETDEMLTNSREGKIKRKKKY